MHAKDCAVLRKKYDVPEDTLPPKLDLKDWLVRAPTVGAWAQRFYKTYVGLEGDELTAHLLEIRRQAFEVYKYRCVASFLFVIYNLEEKYGAEFYDEILQRIACGNKFLDLACGFGNVARNLVYDGAPKENILSTDLRREFWDLGYQMFRDRERFTGEFRQGDVFDKDYLRDLDGTIDILHTSAFFHLFDVSLQQKILRRVLQLMSSKPGTIIFGRQVGNTIPHQVLKHSWRPGRGLYQHSEESFKAMVQEVTDEWDVQVWLTPRTDTVYENGGRIGSLRFIITRLR
jgi:SAM-dependent methyltransferase